VVPASSSSYTVTGTDATLTKSSTAKTITADPGSYTVTGTSATLRHGWKLAAGAGAYSVTGASATVRHGWRLAAGSGAYSVTGSVASLRHAFVMPAAAGSYAVTGTDATLVKGSATAKSIVANVGSYTITGTDATLSANAANQPYPPITGGGHWKGPPEPSYRIHDEYDPDAKGKKKRKKKKVIDGNVVIGPAPVIQTGIVEVKPAWDAMVDLQRMQEEAEQVRRERLRAIALADDEWLMVA
jgi:hypothetical protein